MALRAKVQGPSSIICVKPDNMVSELSKWSDTKGSELLWCMRERILAQSAGARVLVVTWSRCTARAQVNLEVALARIRYLRPRLAFRLAVRVRCGCIGL
jgi:hypothetical protein